MSQYRVLVIKLPKREIERLCSWPYFMTCTIYCNSGIWIINHKYLKKFSSLYMQVSAKRDLYDTSRKIKVHVDGFRGISMVNTVCWDVIESSQDLERKYQELIISQKARRYFTRCRGISLDIEKKMRACKLSQSLRDCRRIEMQKNYSAENHAARVSILL